MTDLSASQTMKKLAEVKGEAALAWAAMRRYSKPVSAVLGATLALGTIIEQGRDAKRELAEIKATQLAQAAEIRTDREARSALALSQVAQIGAFSDRLAHLEGEWGALFGAARITVVPNPVAEERGGLAQHSPAKLYGGPRRPTQVAAPASTPTAKPPR